MECTGLPTRVDFTKLVPVCAPAKSFPANESVRQHPSVSNFPSTVEKMGGVSRGSTLDVLIAPKPMN
jgi:hypothetical protein